MFTELPIIIIENFLRVSKDSMRPRFGNVGYRKIDKQYITKLIVCYHMQYCHFAFKRWSPLLGGSKQPKYGILIR